MDYSASDELSLDLTDRCLTCSDSDSALAHFFGPSNGMPMLNNQHKTIFRHLQMKHTPTKNWYIRSLVGDSGAAGGFALAAALLQKKHSSDCLALVQTSSRGGILAATLINLEQSTT